MLPVFVISQLPYNDPIKYIQIHTLSDFCKQPMKHVLFHSIVKIDLGELVGFETTIYLVPYVVNMHNVLSLH